MKRPVPHKFLLERFLEPFELFGIVHFGLNTYTDREWGYGDEAPALLDPKGFDPDQIVKACKDGGLQGLVIVCKHHDGFCLWPTKTTTHNITQAPFSKYCPDYVKAMSDACKRHGLKCGFYVSPWDRNAPDYATESYREKYWAQVLEIFGGYYGPAFEMWFDGANGGDGYYGGARETRKIPFNYYRFDELIAEVRKIQPQVCVMTDECYGDFNWPGNERGSLSPNARCSYPADGAAPTPGWENKLFMGDINGTYFKQQECDFPIRPGWFCHESENELVKSPEYLMNRYLSSVGNGGNMNIGVSPTKDGVLHQNEVDALVGFGKIKKEFFSKQVFSGTFTSECDTVAIDGSSFNCIVMHEDISNGEQVDCWELYANSSNGESKLIESGLSISVKRIRCFRTPVDSATLQLKVVKQAGEFKSVSFELYQVEQSLLEKVLDAQEPSLNPVENKANKYYRAQQIDAASTTLEYKLESAHDISGLMLTPNAGALGGTPVAFTVEVSEDAENWERIGGEYRLDNIAANPIPQKLSLAQACTAQYIRINVLKTLADGVEPTLMALDAY